MLPRRRGGSVLWNHTLSKFSRGQLGRSKREAFYNNLSLITCSSILDRNTESTTLQGRPAVLLSTPPWHVKFTSFWLGIQVMRTMVSYFLETLGSVKMVDVHIWATMMTLNKFLSFCRGYVKNGSKKMWHSRRTPAGLGHGCFWNCSVSRSPSIPYLPQQNLIIPFFYWSTCLSLSHPADSQHHENVFPLFLALSSAAGTKETVPNYWRKKGRNVGAHSSWPE